MKINKSLLRISFINFISCIIVFYFLDKYSDPNERSLNTTLGSIFWLGIFALLGPLFLSDETRTKLYDKKYIAGTVFIAFINLIATVFGSIIAFILTA